MLWISIILLIISIFVNVINALLSVQYHILRRNSLARSNYFREISYGIEILLFIALLVILVCIGYWYLVILALFIRHFSTKYLFNRIALNEIDGTILDIYPSLNKNLIKRIVGKDEISDDDTVLKAYEFEYYAIRDHLQKRWGKDFIIKTPSVEYLLRHALKIDLINKIKERTAYFQKNSNDNNK
jgi:hypothetical protein